MQRLKDGVTLKHDKEAKLFISDYEAMISPMSSECKSCLILGHSMGDHGSMFNVTQKEENWNSLAKVSSIPHPHSRNQDKLGTTLEKKE